MAAARADGRQADELRPVSWSGTSPSSPRARCWSGWAERRCSAHASFSEEPPRWMRGTGKGWVTAEYSMLPGSSPERIDREAARGRQSGRTQEIQRLIGRSLRAVTDLARPGRAAGDAGL